MCVCRPLLSSRRLSSWPSSSRPEHLRPRLYLARLKLLLPLRLRLRSLRLSL